MKKDIYLIKNLINNKIYIGQSINTKHRWEQHVSASKHFPRCVIDKAIQKYGEENFSIDILEKQIEDYDEKEKYYISLYDSKVPKGYNVAEGGLSVGVGINNVNANFKTQKELDNVIDTIKNSDLNFNTIAEIFGCASSVVSAINLGNAYFQEDLEYPLRQSRIEEERFKQLVYSLKYELDKTMVDIAKEYNIDRSHLNDINQGNIRWKSWLQYPLRTGKIYNVALQNIDEIIDLLKNSTTSQTDIARQFNVSKNVISQINTGQSYKQEGIDYPIRKDYHSVGPRKHTLTPNEIAEIEELLKGFDSTAEIAKKFEVSASTIRNINNGKIKKYFDPNKKYPIRKF